MKKYLLTKLKNSSYDYLVILLTYESILTFINSLEDKIKSNEQNFILFDFAFRNGTKSNRYSIVSIKNKKIDVNSFNIVNAKDISENIKKITLKYFIKHKELLNNSPLSKREIDKLLNFKN